MPIAKKHTNTIPKAAGIYCFKDAEGTVLYVGKAKSLAARINSYFQKSYDWKVVALLEEYATIDYILTKNETEALLLEAQTVKEHKPKYNVLLKEGQPFLYILFTTNDEFPTIEIVRSKRQKGTYFGPFLHKRQARGVAQFLIETFRLTICNKKIANGCLNYHLGKCSGSCLAAFDMSDYLFRLGLAMDVLRNNHRESLKKLKEKIKEYNKTMEFEKSKRLTGYLQNLDIIFETIKTRFNEKKYKDDVFVAVTPTKITAQALALEELSALLKIPIATDETTKSSYKTIKTIDCFDISHFQSSYLVGSCVRFTNGIPDKHKFRRFKIKTLEKQNDYAALQEIVGRRYRTDSPPDLIIIDGGKGQLSAAQAVLPNATIISLAKREETIFGPTFPDGINLNVHTLSGKLVIAIRDYAHHFAVSYHKVRRKNDLRDTAKQPRAKKIV